MKCTECNELIKPIVAVDLDGTLGMYHRHLVDFMCHYFGREIPSERSWDGEGDWEDHLGLTRKQYEEAKLAFRQGGFKRWMPVYPDASFLTRTIAHGGAELWITTTRPYLRLDSVDPDTREWLDRNGIHYDHLLYDEEKYLKILEIVGEGRVVAVVEDLPEQYLSAWECFGAGVAILVQRDHNLSFREQNPGHLVARSLQEASLEVSARISAWKEQS